VSRAVLGCVSMINYTERIALLMDDDAAARRG
jgi:hypothetical protein